MISNFCVLYILVVSLCLVGNGIICFMISHFVCIISRSMTYFNEEWL